MSHDLRTPLNAILGFAQLPPADLGQDRTGKRRSRFSRGPAPADLINEVLDIARIEAATCRSR